MWRTLICTTFLVHTVSTQLIPAMQEDLIYLLQTPSAKEDEVNRFRRETRSGIKIEKDEEKEESRHLVNNDRNDDDNRRDSVTSEDDWQYREPRGAIKDQWIKQPYPVYLNNMEDRSYRDSISSASESRGPRVNFVTQRKLENDRESRGYEREGRMVLPTKSSVNDISLPREEPRNRPRDTYYHDRPQYYEPYPFRFPDPYNRFDDPRYSRHDRYTPNDFDNYRPGTSRQRRIIYYATLPEVVRSPPNVNLRNRYDYRDRFDDLYPLPPSTFYRDPFPYRKPYIYDEELPRAKDTYPLKVSTDLNVREPKKNPEKRIYSEADRRYAYKTSYRVGKGSDHHAQD